MFSENIFLENKLSENILLGLATTFLKYMLWFSSVLLTSYFYFKIYGVVGAFTLYENFIYSSLFFSGSYQMQINMATEIKKMYYFCQ